MTKRPRYYFTCPAEFALYVLSGKWRVAVIAYLGRGPMRFSELRRAIPQQSDKVLAATLRDLENLGLVNKTIAREATTPVVYRLTPKGHELRPTLKLACNWALAHASEYKVRFRWVRLAGPTPHAEENATAGAA